MPKGQSTAIANYSEKTFILNFETASAIELWTEYTHLGILIDLGLQE